MPKGVEHVMIFYFDKQLNSVESLMPKGVEHLFKLFSSAQEIASVESLMPKGVEHWILNRINSAFVLC